MKALLIDGHNLTVNICSSNNYSVLFFAFFPILTHSLLMYSKGKSLTQQGAAATDVILISWALMPNYLLMRARLQDQNVWPCKLSW